MKSHKRWSCTTVLVSLVSSVKQDTCTDTLEVLPIEVMPHGYCYRVYLCYCFLFTKGYLVADTICYLEPTELELLCHLLALISVKVDKPLLR